jgi:hypothetical protein
MQPYNMVQKHWVDDNASYQAWAKKSARVETDNGGASVASDALHYVHPTL